MTNHESDNSFIIKQWLRAVFAWIYLLLSLVDISTSFTEIEGGVQFLLNTIDSEKGSVFGLDVVGSLVSSKDTLNIEATVLSVSSHFLLIFNRRII